MSESPKSGAWSRELRRVVARTEVSGRTTRAAALAIPLLLPLALTGCGGEEEVGAKPDLPSESPALWNPCDVLDEAFIAEQFDSTATENAGTATQPECRFAPADDSGEAAVTANYLLFPGSLEDAWSTMGIAEDADVREPDIEGADETRIVVNPTADQLYVTGFVQTGDLIQQVDVVDPAPYDKKRVVTGVQTTLTVLADHAVESGVDEESGEDATEEPSD